MPSAPNSNIIAAVRRAPAFGASRTGISNAATTRQLLFRRRWFRFRWRCRFRYLFLLCHFKSVNEEADIVEQIIGIKDLEPPGRFVLSSSRQSAQCSPTSKCVLCQSGSDRMRPRVRDLICCLLLQILCNCGKLLKRSFQSSTISAAITSGAGRLALSSRPVVLGRTNVQIQSLARVRVQNTLTRFSEARYITLHAP